MCENSVVVIYLVLSHDKIREEKSIPTRRMKEWSKSGLAGAINQLNEQSQIWTTDFWEEQIYTLCERMGSEILSVVLQAKISKFLRAKGRKRRKSSYRQSSAWIFYIPLSLRLSTAHVTYYFSGSSPSQEDFTILNGPITIKHSACPRHFSKESRDSLLTL